jgi:hypothetical protein
VTLSSSLRRTQNFFHDRTQARGLLMNLFDHLFRFLHPDSGHFPVRFRLPSRVVIFFAVHNLTDWFHNATFVLPAGKCKSIVSLFFIQRFARRLAKKTSAATANVPRWFEPEF